MHSPAPAASSRPGLLHSTLSRWRSIYPPCRCVPVPWRPASSRRASLPKPLPSGGLWLHEIKHDGFRIIARKNGAQVRLYSRPGNDFTRRFPLIVDALSRLRSRSCIIDGEAVASDENGVASFDLVRHHRANDSVFLYAFDLIELNGDDLRRDQLEVRKATLASIVAKAGPGIRFNEYVEAANLAHQRGQSERNP